MATRQTDAVDLLARATAVLGSAPADAESALTALLELCEGEREERARRLEALARVQNALARLRSVSTVDRILRLATVEACTQLGFDRAILFSVQGSEMVCEHVFFRREPAWAAEIERIAAEHHPKLDHMLLETEMLRRRRPALVADAQNDPRADAILVEATRTRSYVAAPIMPRGRVLGFLHADCYFSGRDVDELDRDTLWAFAEGYGYAMDRALLMHRLQALTREVRHVADAAEGLAAEQDGTELGLAHADDLAASVVATTASIVAPGTDARASLTAREREVLEHMAAGRTNAAIAGELVIAEETVKSHVKQILRKLRAANRAEAVSRYMQLRQG